MCLGPGVFLLGPQSHWIHQLPWWLSGKESTCLSRRHRLDPLGWEDPLEEEWQPTPVFLPGESHRQRSLVGYSPWHHRVRHN